jgi:hypothetical protein
MPYVDHAFSVAFHACFLVHEATHGEVSARGIRMTPEFRSKVERLCVAEQNRFAARLTRMDPERYPPDLLRFEFNEKDWHPDWTATPREWRKAVLSRWVSDIRAGLKK